MQGISCRGFYLETGYPRLVLQLRGKVLSVAGKVEQNVADVVLRDPYRWQRYLPPCAQDVIRGVGTAKIALKLRTDFGAGADVAREGAREGGRERPERGWARGESLGRCV